MASKNKITTMQYYQSTQDDFKEFWVGNIDLAMHFGYSEGKQISHSQSLLRMNEVLAKFSDVSENDHVLDAGCGFGGSALWLAENFDCTVIGVNIVPSQLEVGRRNAKYRHLSHLVSFRLQDYSATIFDDGEFSLIWALETIFHNSNKDEVISEAYRLLGKSGRLLLAEFMVSENLGHCPQLSGQLQLIEDGWALNGIMTPGGYRTLLDRSGFQNVQILDLTEKIRESISRLAGVCRDALPSAKNKFIRGEWDEPRYKNVEASILVEELVNNGLFNYVAILAEKSGN